MDYQHRVIPFYMAHPTPYFMKEEDSVLRDLEYLQQMYPEQAKMLQVRVAGILDKMDYEGSLLYDEYPDKWQLYRLGDSVVEILKREDMEKEESERTSPEKWEWIRDMVQLVLYYEIYKRRHGNRRGFLKF
ncbi:MAG: hypothetical protein IJ405_05695 [Lachnospiraceae bacterium]|nr:hypothetical protein [Lachnospiraceae bacterium]